MARKGEFGESWWARRWISVLESFGWSSRLQRGRSYARHGNVLEIAVAPGEVKAKVQGSRPRPYKVSIHVEPLTDAEWNKVTSAMARQAVFTARLLAGEMPENIEEAFARSKVSLFPTSSRDIATTCSCPDWANPCKHIAAVYYVLGEEFDRDPFLLFFLRGRSREDLMTALREKRLPAACPGADPSSEGYPSSRGGAASGTGRRSRKREIADSVYVSEEAFWNGDREKLSSVPISVNEPAVPAAIPKRLGVPGFWNANPHLNNKDFIRALEDYYQTVSKQALALAYGGAGNGQGDKGDPR